MSGPVRECQNGGALQEGPCATLGQTLLIGHRSRQGQSFPGQAQRIVCGLAERDGALSSHSGGNQISVLVDTCPGECTETSFSKHFDSTHRSEIGL